MFRCERPPRPLRVHPSSRGGEYRIWHNPIRMSRTRSIVLVFTALSAVYLYAFPSATIPYLTLILGHVAAGFVLAAFLIPVLIRSRSIGWIVTAAGAGLGILLVFTGGSRPFAPLLYGHIGVSMLGIILLLAER